VLTTTRGVATGVFEALTETGPAIDLDEQLAEFNGG